MRGVHLADDLRFAIRALRRNASTSVLAALTLGISIGAATAVFSVVDAVLDPIPFEDPDRLMAIHGTSPASAANPLSYPNFLDVQERTRTFEAIAAWHLEMFTIAGPPHAERPIGGRVSAAYFSILRVQPLLGRVFRPDDDRAGAPPVALLGEGLWRRRFGADPGVIGRSITLDGRPHTVIGVLPATVGVGVIARRYNDVVVPIGQYEDPVFRSRHVNAAAAIGRLRAGVTIAEARAEMEAIARALQAAYPADNAGVGLAVVAVRDTIAGELEATMALLLTAVAFMLLIASANVANLMLARVAVRGPDTALRLSLGASRASIVRQTLAESLLLALAAGAAGLLLSAWGTHSVLALLPSAIPDSATVGVNVRVLLFAAGASALTGVICGAIPALRSARCVPWHLLQGTGRSEGLRRPRAQHALVAAQLAVTLMLLAGAGLMARSLALLWRVDPGFDPRGVVTFMSGLPPERASRPESIRDALRGLTEHLASAPGVQAASVVFGAVPYTGNNNAVDFWRDGEPRPLGGRAPVALFSAVEPDYFGVMRIPLRRGRLFARSDTTDTAPVVIVDEAFARSVFGAADPVGRRVYLEPLSRPADIVGVVGHVKHWSLDPAAASGAPFQVYIPAMQLPDALAAMAAHGFSVVARSERPAADQLPALRRALDAFAGGSQAMTGARAMQEALASSLERRRFSLVVLALFAALALLVASLGAYAVASYLVSRRTHELAVRVALGAQRRNIVRTVAGGGALWALGGVMLGVVATLGLSRFLAGMLFGVAATDPLTLGAAAALLLLVAAAAFYLPARRATRVDPVTALRHV
jgi:predicted permease